MAIQWFPGHMHTTRLALDKRLRAGIDVVIEMLDARLPGASANPLLASLTVGKPALKLLNKQDLADPAATAAWLAHYNALPDTRAIALDAGETAPAARLIPACRALAPLRGGMVKPLRVLICGIPNVGKSTLINTLVRRKAAKTGDEAGVTKTEQVVALASDITLYDTPGMLWPRISVPESGLLLAASGAVGKNAYDEEEVALGLLPRLQARYPVALATRYKLLPVPAAGEPDAGAHPAAGLAALAAQPADELLAQVARKRGLVQTGGTLALHKAAEALINDFRSGALGRVTLETPAEHAAWQAAAAERDVQRQDQAAARTARRKASRVVEKSDSPPAAALKKSRST